ncbi:DNA-protecting protein DprA [Candidatus Nomurabacteria bacterium]|nr:DNA-protecting protein DprA [Candidatus Nomurabacteria bacterium]
MDAFPIIEVPPDALFPSLKEIPQNPKTLFVRGNTTIPEGQSLVVIVGSRNCTSYGKSVCRSLIAGLKGYPIAIVSGLALGIDSVAHEAALDAGIPTIAFPGSGLGTKALYPAQHRQLAQRILENGGLLVSEYPSDTRAAQWTFPQRNRLMAGVGTFVLVVEAEMKSGTLITARLGTEYNKIVGAIPGPITSPSSEGTNWLLKLGAVPVTGVEDILRELNLLTEEISSKHNETIASTEELHLLALLTEPRTRDQLIALLDADPSEVTILLSTLEIKGLIRESFGTIERTH